MGPCVRLTTPFLKRSKHLSSIEYPNQILQESLQELLKYVVSELFPTEKFTNGDLVTPHPWTDCRWIQ